MDRLSQLKRSGFTIVELLIVIVVIAILAAITIVSYNGVTSRARDAVMKSDISSWKTKAQLHMLDAGISCPDNYVFVYGNATLGTSDFCVMKYEAKNDGGVATSQAPGTPWVSITQTAAISTAAAACAGCHLLSEAEWMTLAADVLSVKYNWSGGAVGSGYVYGGHNDNVPASAIEASTDDDDGYANTGNSASSGANEKRTLYLTSGDIIWDFAGNVWEWTQGTITGAQPGLSSDSADTNVYAWKEWNDPGLQMNGLPASSRPSALAGVPGLTSIAGWNSGQSLGVLYSNQNQTGARGFARGGVYGHPLNTGVLALILNNAPSGSGASIGFRVAR